METNVTIVSLFVLEHVAFITHRIHVWHIYLHLVDLFIVNVGKYTIHGCYG